MKTLLTFIFISFLIAGCSPPLYVAEPPATPLFKKSQQLNAAGAFGSSGLQASASYSMSDHIFIFGGASVLSVDSVKETRNKSIEGGLGVFYYLDEPSFLPLGLKYNHLELLTGYGNGSANGLFKGYIFPDEALSYYNKYFMQVTAAYSSQGSRISGAFSGEEAGQVLRFSFLNYYKFSSGDNRVKRNLDNLFFEYYFFTGLQYGILKLKGTAGVAFPLQNKPEFGNSFFSVSIAASLNFNL